MGSSTGRAGSVASWMSAFEFPFRPATAQVVLKKLQGTYIHFNLQFYYTKFMYFTIHMYLYIYINKKVGIIFNQTPTYNTNLN